MRVEIRVRGLSLMSAWIRAVGVVGRLALLVLPLSIVGKSTAAATNWVYNRVVRMKLCGRGRWRPVGRSPFEWTDPA